MKLENSVKYHSAANGMVENAVQRVTVLTRVLKDTMEAKIKQATEPKHSADAIHGEPCSNHHRQILYGSGRQDPLSRRIGRRPPAHREMAEFGEKILFQPMKYNNGKRST